MKSTEAFKETILSHLQDKAVADAQFALSFVKDDRNIDDCVTYILNKVQKSRCNGFTDAEVFDMAEEYYTKEKVEVGSKSNANVVVNHKVEKDKEAPTKKEEKPKAKTKLKSKLKVVVNNTEPKATEKPKIFEPTLF